jgi:hypothetical protein
VTDNDDGYKRVPMKIVGTMRLGPFVPIGGALVGDACPPTDGFLAPERHSLVQRLRDYYTEDGECFRIEHQICDEAADEIERLRGALTASNSWLYGHPTNPEGQAERRRLNEALLGA